jgi:hypothetical protein
MRGNDAMPRHDEGEEWRDVRGAAKGHLRFAIAELRLQTKPQDSEKN